LTCKNRLPYNLHCVGGDVKHCTILPLCLFFTSLLFYVGGIHTSKATFGNKSPALAGHSRVPSDDLVLGLPNLSAIQSSVSRMNVRPHRQQADTDASDGAGCESAAKAECSSLDSTDGASVDESVVLATEPSHVSSPVLSTSSSHSPLLVDSVSAPVTLTSLPPSLADLQNPATFSIQPSPKHGRKITKASFFDPDRPMLGETADGSEGSADPLSRLDPLWSLKPPSKDSVDSEQS